MTRGGTCDLRLTSNPKTSSSNQINLDDRGVAALGLHDEYGGLSSAASHGSGDGEHLHRG